MANKAIAFELGISVYTVRYHIEAIAAKPPPSNAPPKHLLMVFFLNGGAGVRSGTDSLSRNAVLELSPAGSAKVNVQTARPGR